MKKTYPLVKDFVNSYFLQKEASTTPALGYNHPNPTLIRSA